MSTINKPHSKYPHVYAIVRMDPPVDEKYLMNSITVVKVFSSEEDAEAEVARLNKINAGKRCIYFGQITRFISSSRPV